MVAGCPIVNATVWPVSAENFAAIALAAAKGAPVLKTRSSAASVARGASAAISSNPAVRALWRRREWAVAPFSVIAILPYPMLLSDAPPQHFATPSITAIHACGLAPSRWISSAFRPEAASTPLRILRFRAIYRSVTTTAAEPPDLIFRFEGL